MTFNHHWMRNLRPHCIEITLADGSVVYSEGVGLVRFNPVVEGQEMVPLEFMNVLYVPALCNNLFSVLYFASHRHFIIIIEKDTMHFIRDSKISFQAKTGASTAAYLSCWEHHSCQGIASLSSATTLPLDWHLWNHKPILIQYVNPVELARCMQIPSQFRPPEPQICSSLSIAMSMAL